MDDLVILANDRDRRVLAWLRETQGDSVILNALSLLSGARKPYLSNVLKILNLEAPDNLLLTDRDVARAHLANLKAMLPKS
jgi:hypothetical protein